MIINYCLSFRIAINITLFNAEFEGTFLKHPNSSMQFMWWWHFYEFFAVTMHFLNFLLNSLFVSPDSSFEKSCDLKLLYLFKLNNIKPSFNANNVCHILSRVWKIAYFHVFLLTPLPSDNTKLRESMSKLYIKKQQ